MFQHRWSVIFRHFQSLQSAFFINSTGLSTALAGVLLSCRWVSDEWLIGKFNQKDNPLFQVMDNRTTPEGIQSTSSRGRFAQALAEVLLEIAYALARFVRLE